MDDNRAARLTGRLWRALELGWGNAVDIIVDVLYLFPVIEAATFLRYRTDPTPLGAGWLTIFSRSAQINQRSKRAL
jgi:hypothetical protein